MYSAHNPASRRGLPHSEISGLTPARGSPELIAACHVLHRLSVPRHPPNALILLPPLTRTHKSASRRAVHPHSRLNSHSMKIQSTVSAFACIPDATKPALRHPRQISDSQCQTAKLCCATRDPFGRDQFGVAAKRGGGERDRTDDLLLAKQALSQLSYTPRNQITGTRNRTDC